MSQELPHIIPVPQPQVEDTFASYQTTHEFYYELQARSELKKYSEWYYTTAETHRQELERMRGELNIMQWFRRK